MKKIILVVFLLVFLGCGREIVRNQEDNNSVIEKESLKDEEIIENRQKAKYPRLLSDLQNFSLEIDSKNLKQLESKKINEWYECEGDFRVGKDCGPPDLRYVYELKEKVNKDEAMGSSENKIFINVYGFNEVKRVMQKYGNDLLKNIETVILESGDPDKLLDENFPMINSPGGDYGDFKRLNGQNIKGFRGLHHHTMAAGPIINGEYFYSFKGISEDRKYLIILSAFFYSPALDNYYENPKNRENGMEELENEESHMKALNVFKSDLNQNKTIPSLKQLDELVQSIELVEK